MFKSRWIRIPLKILLIWLAITVYFYFQHPVIYRYKDINVKTPIGDEQLIIDEISVNNIDEDKRSSYFYSRKIPWQYQLLWKLDLPQPWNIYVGKAISFYSRPPLAKDSGTLLVSGTYIYPKTFSATDIEAHRDRFDISVYPWGCSGSGYLEEFFKNALIIRSRGKFPLGAMDNPIIITITDNVTTKSTQLVLTPQWHKERLICLRDVWESPADPVRNFIGDIYQNKPQHALEHVMPELKENFPIPSSKQTLIGKKIQIEGNLGWIDIFEDYFGVYQVDAEVGEFNEDSTKDFIPQDRITFYTRKDNDGNYKIIYWQRDE